MGSYTVTLTVTGPGGSNSKGMTIQVSSPPPPDDRTWVSVMATDSRASESGDIGVFTISRSGSTASAVTVRFSLGGNAQNGVDYQTLPTSVKIPAGASSVELKVVPIDDSTPERANPEIDEPVYLMLEQGPGYIVGLPNNAAVYIVDNDQPPVRPTVTVVASDPNASEAGDPGIFTVRLSESVATAMTVKYTMGGNAQNGVEYQTLSGEVTFPAGATSAQVVVRPIEDSSVEIDEPVYLMLFGYTGAPYVVGKPDAATVIIADND